MYRIFTPFSDPGYAPKFVPGLRPFFGPFFARIFCPFFGPGLHTGFTQEFDPELRTPKKAQIYARIFPNFSRIFAEYFFIVGAFFLTRILDNALQS